MPLTVEAFSTFTDTSLWGTGGAVVVVVPFALVLGRLGGGRRRRWSGPDGVEGVDHVLRIGLRLLQHVGSAVGDEAASSAGSR